MGFGQRVYGVYMELWKITGSVCSGLWDPWSTMHITEFFRWTESCQFFFSVAQSHSFSWNFRPKNPNFPTKTLFPSPPTAPPMWGARSCARGCRGSRSWRSFGRRGGCCGSSWEARRPWSSAALGHGTGESPNPPSPGFEDLEHYPLVIADIAIEHGYL